MALMMYALNTVILLLYTVIVSQALGKETCSDPLGMENEKIKDPQITVSSVFRSLNSGKSARLRRNLHTWGAWCPNTTNAGNKNIYYDEYIQIDLLDLTTITKVATQGRELAGGVEFVKTYQISYSYDNRKWMYYREESSDVKIFTGNTDVKTVVESKIVPPVVARYVRIHPGYTYAIQVCLRLELYGCLNEGACSDPLGMENEKIKDPQITVSSVFRSLNSGKSARLRRNLHTWGAWCPNITNAGNKSIYYDEYIQIDLLDLTTITKVATQGMELAGGGGEFVKTYQISYSYDNRKWMYYREESSDVKIFTGNTDVKTVVESKIVPPVVARYVRIHPGYTYATQVCLRLELYGCLNEGGILSYSIPQGDKTKTGWIKYEDTIYNGVVKNGILYNGTGLLTDGEIGTVDSKKEKEKGWIGWNQKDSVNITFKFFALRKFNDVTITVNINNTRKFLLFKNSKILFGVREEDLSQSSALEYCPKQVKETDTIIDSTLPLCGNVGKFVRIQLHPAGRWLLISEIKFNSVEVHKTEKTSFQTCPVNANRCFFNTSSVSPSFSTNPLCTDCSTGGSEPVSDNSGNFQMTILIICLVLVVVILLLVVVFFLYRRRMLCFGTLKRGRSKDDHTAVNVELHERDETVADPTYDEVNYKAPASLTQMPDNEDGYECPSRPESGYVLPAQSSYPVAGYAPLITPAPEDDHQYQKLLKLSTYPAAPPILNGNDDIREPPSRLTQMPNNEENQPEEEDEIEEGYEYPSRSESGYVIPAQSTFPAPGYTSLITPAPDEDDHQYQNF